ncbi:MAG TPA: GNAT family N-acetyltransferase, partial [Rhodanobacteraceae bacterium]
MTTRTGSRQTRGRAQAGKQPARIALRALSASDVREFIAAVRVSRSLHRPWTSPPVTPAAFRTYFERLTQPGQRAFVVCRRDTGSMVGLVAMSQIVLGPFRSAYLGYYAFAGHEGRGLMREGLEAVVRFAFRSMRLHRLEANIQPGNRASIALARSCGFR